MTFVVTGASGFIGSTLVAQLAERHRVVALTRSRGGDRLAAGSRAEWRIGHPADRRWLRSVIEPGSTLVHLAGLKSAAACTRDVPAALDANLTLTRSVIEAAREAGVARLVFASTYWVYGRRQPDELPCDEDAERRPVDVYGMTKALAEELVFTSGLDHIVLRLSNVFGRGAAGVNEDVVFHMVRSAVERSVIEVDGEGTQTLDLIDVDRACICLQRLAELEVWPFRAVNIASGRAIAVMDLAGLIAHEASHLAKTTVDVLHRPPAEPQPFSKAVSIARLERLLAPYEHASLEDMLSAFMRPQTVRAVQ